MVRIMGKRRASKVSMQKLTTMSVAKMLVCYLVGVPGKRVLALEYVKNCGFCMHDIMTVLPAAHNTGHNCQF